MAIPVGRALFTFSTFRPSPRDPIVIPDVCISGKALPRGNTVKLDLDIPAEMIHWSEFHSGVATGKYLLLYWLLVRTFFCIVYWYVPSSVLVTCT